MRALISVLCLSAASALVVSPVVRQTTPVSKSRAFSPAAVITPGDLLPAATLLAEITDVNGERAYGAVDAPPWVLPVLAIGTIATSLLPLLLQPGEEALNKMRANEQNKFGSGKTLGGDRKSRR